MFHDRSRRTERHRFSVAVADAHCGHRNEVRFLRFDDDHYRASMPDLPALGSLAGNRAVPKPVPPDLPRYFPVDWRPQDALEHITISPYADEAYETTARDVLIWAAGSASFGDKIELSILHPHLPPSKVLATASLSVRCAVPQFADQVKDKVMAYATVMSELQKYVQ
jgi:hypothetical protein